MAASTARDGLPVDWRNEPPPAQIELLPVLFDGYRPPARAKRVRRKPKIITGHTPAQLTIEDLLAQLQAAEEMADRAAREMDSVEGVPQIEPWSEDEVYRLHVFVLERSLDVLADTRTSKATVTEILAWVGETPDEPAAGISYRRCCALLGYDPDELAELLSFEVGRLHGVCTA